MNLDGVFLDGGMSGMDWTVCDLDGGGLNGIYVDFYIMRIRPICNFYLNLNCIMDTFL